MTKLLYYDNSYLKEFKAKVINVKDKKIVELDQTAFYPSGGGQPCDYGELVSESGDRFKIISVVKENNRIYHEVDKEGLEPGKEVRGFIDWERRYKLMRSHTAAHIVSALINKKTNALITGNQLDVDKVRIDFNLADFNSEELKNYITEANKIIEENLTISTQIISRKEAEMNPSLSKLAIGLPEGIENIRIVSIGNFDSQADGGTHVRQTSEIGKLEFLKAENKGKNNRRLYFILKP